MPISRRLLGAIAASLALHAGVAAALTRLPSGAVVTPTPSCESACFVMSEMPPSVTGADKLLAGQHTSTESIGVFPVATQYGPTIGDVPKAGPSLANPGPGGGPNGSAGNNGITEATTQFFGTPTRGQRIVYVIDRSASMGENGRLDVARQELMASLRRLPANAFFQVIVYNSTDEILVGNAEMLVPASPENIAHVEHALATLEPVGGTRHLTAITVALRMRPDVVYFLTDADDLSKTDQTSIQRLNADHAIFHTIELTRVHCGQPGMPMQVLASSTGGTYRALDVPPLR